MLSIRAFPEKSKLFILSFFPRFVILLVPFRLEDSVVFMKFFIAEIQTGTQFMVGKFGHTRNIVFLLNNI
ncbi:MAG: hypothetical protein EBS19_09235, partial [Spirochaetia bacterium]|nr:hypothetical protein [Spirochaetia bacterium]